MILVTGAGGFIGGHLVRYLRQVQPLDPIRAVDAKPLDRWYQVSDDPLVESRQADLMRAFSCRAAMQGVRDVYNLAADMGGMGFIEAHKAECMLSVLINTQLLMCARDYGISKQGGRYFFASSACVYAADKQALPTMPALKESDAYPAMPEDGYGWEKLFSERMCRHFREDFLVDTCVARYHNVYGPHGTFEGGREKAPAALARKVATAVLTGHHEIEIWGDGTQTRSFTYIDDAVEGTVKLLASQISEPLNIGSDEQVSINRLVEMLELIAGVQLRRIYKPNAPKGVPGRNSDNTLILKRLGWVPSWPLMIGLEKTYRWIYDQLKPRLTK